MQAGGRRFDPVNLHHVSEQESKPESRMRMQEAHEKFRFGFLRPLAVSFFNNLEEVKINQMMLAQQCGGVI